MTHQSEVLNLQVTFYLALEVKHVFKIYFKLWKMIGMSYQTKENHPKRLKTGSYICKDLKEGILKLFLYNFMIILFVLFVEE